MEKVYVYHHNDHDGIISAGVLYNLNLKEKYKSEDIIFNMIDYQVNLNFDHINPEDKVYFLDYSFSNTHNIEAFKNLIKNGNENITWIDHHKSSVKILNDLKQEHELENFVIDGIVQEGLCGAAWTYLYCYEMHEEFAYNSREHYADRFQNNKHIPQFLKYIDDYDCWKHIYPETNDFHYGLTVSDPKDPIISTLLEKQPAIRARNYVIQIIESGKEIQKYLNFENREYHVNMYGFEYTLPEDHGGYKCFCLNRKGNSIMFGDKVKEYDAVIPFYFNGNRWTYSMFTEKDNVDCESVARSYGGGGHLKAAGWTSDKLIFE